MPGLESMLRMKQQQVKQKKELELKDLLPQPVYHTEAVTTKTNYSGPKSFQEYKAKENAIQKGEELKEQRIKEYQLQNYRANTKNKKLVNEQLEMNRAYTPAKERVDTQMEFERDPVKNYGMLALELGSLIPAIGGPLKTIKGASLVDDAINLKLFGLFNDKTKKIKNIVDNTIDIHNELKRANNDALNFSNSPYNRKKLEVFRQGNKDFNVTNTEALFHNDPKAREKFKSLMNDDIEFREYGNIENWMGMAEGNYGARDFGDMNDLSIVNKFKNNIYDAAIHETGHSRSVRLGVMPEERKILDDAWSGLRDYKNKPLDEKEQEAVLGELRMKLNDKLGNRIYTDKDKLEITEKLKEMIDAKHPYMQDINHFDVNKIITSLNKIGLASTLPLMGIFGTQLQSKDNKQIK